MKHDKPMKLGDAGIDSPQRLARKDRARIKKMNIISPDTSKMYSLTYGNTVYYFRTKRKMKNFIDNNNHYKILGMNIHNEDKEPPTVDERFSNANQILEEDETR